MQVDLSDEALLDGALLTTAKISSFSALQLSNNWSWGLESDSLALDDNVLLC